MDLVEQINFIGGNVTAGKRADIILQGLPAEYDLIRYCDSADGGYDLAKIESTARNMWYTRTRSDGIDSGRGRHRSSARDASMIMTTSPDLTAALNAATLARGAGILPTGTYVATTAILGRI